MDRSSPEPGLMGKRLAQTRGRANPPLPGERARPVLKSCLFANIKGHRHSLGSRWPALRVLGHTPCRACAAVGGGT